MGRPREFDEDEVIDRALEAFWTHGYEATSMADLMEATGLAKGSVYKGFGDKRSFFLRTLDVYLERGRAHLADFVAESESPLATLRKWLSNVVGMAVCDGVRKGCFSINCSIELAPHDEEVRARLQEHERLLERHYETLIRRGIELGEFRDDLDARAAARWVTTVIGGIQVAAKTGLTRKDADEMVDLAIEALR